MKNKRKKGFTLIELLVVVSIISFLASVIFASVNDARKKGRDARRIADFKQIETALELYYNDYGQYPVLGRAYTTSDSCGLSGRWCTLENLLASYIAKLPRDPSGLQDIYRYYYNADANDDYQTYGIMCSFEHSGNFYLVGIDGGYYQGIDDGRFYERGSQPAYCMSKYTGSDANWWENISGQVCSGGD